MMLTVKAEVGELERLCREVKTFCDGYGITASQTAKLVLALEELFTNGMCHGQVHETDVGLEYVGGRVVVTLEDDGRPFDPWQRPAPDLDAPLEERSVGGLGIFLVRSLMDEVAYERRGERNRVTLTLAAVARPS
ncbi:MAG TPA: ATP-binding protein [Polyangia bacterium]|nr:ATP-binding protein [Polyangia bacterium]